LPQPDLSIVLPTCNRGELLARSLESIRTRTQCEYEVIVVDGASTDSTAAVLDAAAATLGDRLTVIREPRREGFVRAANKGFAAATGRCMTWLNDDARPLPGAFDAAVRQVDASPADVGLVALYHRIDARRNVAYECTIDGYPYRLLHVRGTLYANFGVGRRETFRDVGYFDERYYLNAADPDFSLKLWNAGLRVVPAAYLAAAVDHDEHADDRRATDTARGDADNAALFAKWDLPPKNPDRNDYDPARPCTLRGLRAAAAAA